MTEITTRALEISIGQVGQQENPKGSNWGHPVQDYLKSVGLGSPAPWCMALMYYSFDNAAIQFGIENPLFKTGSVMTQWHNRIANRIKDAPAIGDIMIMDHGHGVGHTGIIESLDPDGKTLHTVEGNTNDTGSREGFQVLRKTRLISNPQIIGYLRF